MIAMRDLVVLAATVLLCAATAGCGDPPAATAAQTPEPVATTPSPADASSADEHVTRRFSCQAGTGAELLDDGTLRVSLPDGEHHTLTHVAGSDPQVYTGDSLYFTIQEGAAHLSQQDGARELACTDAANAG
jgi:hypothetical protein